VPFEAIRPGRGQVMGDGSERSERARKAAETKRRKADQRRKALEEAGAWPEVLPNARLTLDHVPPVTADIREILHFALSYEGYDETGGNSNASAIANARRNDTLHDLRVCLFFEQRRGYWSYDGLEDKKYLRELIAGVREKLRAAGRLGSGRRRAGRLDPEVYKRAIALAGKWHREQTVPGSDLPYLVHVAKVAMEVIAATEGEKGVDRDLAVACALLHDTIEDVARGDVPRVEAEILQGFGREVLAGVAALTKDQALPKPERMADSLRRIREQPREVWMVKLADRITNLEPPPAHWEEDKKRRYLDEAREILSALGEASGALRQRFERKLSEYGAYRDAAQERKQEA
jgi:5'-deoxynucleotidase YfbR-like HD superfamily hydrolase